MITKTQAGVNEGDDRLLAVQQARRRALLVPREHGAWGLLLIPLFTGIAAGFAASHRSWPLIVFTLATLCLFWLRTILESLLGTGPVKASTSEERSTAVTAAISLSAVSVLCLALLMWRGRNLDLFLLGAVAGCAFVAQAAVRRLGKRARMASQLIGTIGLTCTAPAAYYVATGRLDLRAIVLWVANWVFAGNQIHFVQLRIHAARAVTVAEKFERGKLFLITQFLFVATLVCAALWRLLPPLMILAFVPVIVRGTHWFFRKPQSLDVKRLGWSEMKHGMAFGSLLAIALICS